MRSICVVIALLAATPALAAPPQTGGKARQIFSPGTGRVGFDRLRPSQRASHRPDPMARYRRGNVYLDYAAEDVKFRFEKKTGRVFRRFNGQPEVEVSYTSNLFRDAISAGKPISRGEYFRPVNR